MKLCAVMEAQWVHRTGNEGSARHKKSDAQTADLGAYSQAKTRAEMVDGKESWQYSGHSNFFLCSGCASPNKSEHSR